MLLAGGGGLIEMGGCTARVRLGNEKRGGVRAGLSETDCASYRARKFPVIQIISHDFFNQSQSARGPPQERRGCRLRLHGRLHGRLRKRPA